MVCAPLNPSVDSQFIDHHIPGITVSKFGRLGLGSAQISVLHTDVRTRLEELGDAPLILGERCPVQHGATFMINRIRVGTRGWACAM